MRLVVLTADFYNHYYAQFIFSICYNKSMFNIKCIDHKIRRDKVATAVPNYKMSAESLPSAYA